MYKTHDAQNTSSGFSKNIKFQPEDDHYDRTAKLPKLSDKKEKNTIRKKGPLFHPLPLIPEYSTTVLESYR